MTFSYLDAYALRQHVPGLPGTVVKSSSSLTSCRPALVVLATTGTPIETYRGRISTDDRYVTLSDVTGADEGSYTVRDAQGDIKKKVCLNVKGKSKTCAPTLDLF